MVVRLEASRHVWPYGFKVTFQLSVIRAAKVFANTVLCLKFDSKYDLTHNALIELGSNERPAFFPYFQAISRHEAKAISHYTNISEIQSFMTKM